MASEATTRSVTPPNLRTAGWYVLLGLLSLIVLLPVWITFMRAISNPAASIDENALVPHQLEWDAFSRAWTKGHLGGALLRSLLVTVLITLGQVVTSVMGAYAFAYLRFPLKRLVFAAFMATLLLPLEVTLLPNLHTVRDLDWFNSIEGLTVPFAATAFGTFLIRQGFMGIPEEIRDATRLDGYGHTAFLTRFAVPLTRPVIASFTVISFLGAFNQYLWPRAIITDTDNWATIQVALRSITTNPEQANIPIAGAIIAAVPIVVLLILFQRHIIRGLTAGAVKG